MTREEEDTIPNDDGRIDNVREEREREMEIE